jgi:hypothetical protein
MSPERTTSSASTRAEGSSASVAEAALVVLAAAVVSPVTEDLRLREEVAPGSGYGEPVNRIRRPVTIA